MAAARPLVITVPNTAMPDGRADVAEELRRRGRDAEVGAVDGVLHDERVLLHRHAEAEAQHDHGDRELGLARGPRQAGEQPHARAHDDDARDHDRLVAPGAGDDQAGHDAHDDEAEHQRHEDEAGVRRVDAEHPLRVDRDVDDRAEHHHRDREARDVARGEHRGAEEAQRDDRLLGAQLDEHEREEGDGADRVEAEDRRGAPRVGRAAEGGREQEADERDGEGRDAEVVDPGLAALVRQVEEAGDDDRGHEADGHRGEEEPAPAPVVGDEAAGQGARDRRDAEDRAHEALVLAALTGGDDVADDRLGQRHQGAHAQALDGAAEDEHPEVPGEPTDDRADHEDDEAGEVEAAAAVEVGQLADDGHGDRGDEHRGRGDPAVVLHAAELGDDARHRGADDRLADRRDEHAEHEADEDAPGLGGQAVGLDPVARRRLGEGGGHAGVLSVVAARCPREAPSRTRRRVRSARSASGQSARASVTSAARRRRSASSTSRPCSVRATRCARPSTGSGRRSTTPRSAERRHPPAHGRGVRAVGLGDVAQPPGSGVVEHGDHGVLGPGQEPGVTRDRPRHLPEQHREVVAEGRIGR